MIHHAGLIARWDAGLWRGALIEGASGAGKSDLMLRALAAGWALVADDRVMLWTSGARLFGRAPPVLAGLMEIRGLGVMPMAFRPFAEVCLVARCVDAAQIERTPEIEAISLQNRAIPLVRLTAFEASAPTKLAYALTRVGLPPQPAYQASRAGGDHPDAGGVP